MGTYFSFFFQLMGQWSVRDLRDNGNKDELYSWADEEIP